MRDIFLSDLHIGVDAATNLYLSSAHEPELKAVLRYIQDNADQIRNVVILGDWIDLWMYRTTAVPMERLPVKREDRENFLPTPGQIFEANPSLFRKQSDGSGDFVTCIENITGNFYYVRGNHDITVSDDEINSFLPHDIAEDKKITCYPDGYSSGNVYGEHGNFCSMVCKPCESLPFGYFMTRAAADGGVKTPADLGAKLQALVEAGHSFADAMLICIADQVGRTTPFQFQMPDGTIMDASEVIGRFKDTSAFNLNVYKRTDGLMASDNLKSYARDLVNADTSRKIVVLGHTHEEVVVQDFMPVYVNSPCKALRSTYANCGFLCGGENPPPSTFVEIVHAAGTEPERVNVYELAYADDKPFVSLKYSHQA
ncbi:MAG TPA: hypothetical protein VI298_13245 [Geobacteraceae bacterium]